MAEPKAPMITEAPLAGERRATPAVGSGALDALYRQHASWLTGLLRRRLGTFGGDAEDLVQDVYVRAGRYAAADLVLQPKALLRQIGINLARDYMRRNVIRGWSTEAGEIGGRSAAALTTSSTQEAELELKRIVLALPPTYRDVFILSRFTRMTNEDIAAHFAISVKTVEWRLSKALGFCARHLAD